MPPQDDAASLETAESPDSSADGSLDETLEVPKVTAEESTVAVTEQTEPPVEPIAPAVEQPTAVTPTVPEQEQPTEVMPRVPAVIN